jgi:hypothetical protein
MVHRRVFPAVVGIVLVAGLLAGCTMTAKGPSDEEQIMALINKFTEAGNKGDLETLMAAFADDFAMDTGEDKDAVRAVLEEGLAAGVEFDATDAKVTVAPDGNTAKVEGVTVDYTPYATNLKKMNGQWLITGAGEQY